MNSSTLSRTARYASLTLLLAGIGLTPSVSPRAQKKAKEAPVNVARVSTRQSGESTVVTLSADAALTRTQTWQDEEGFHVVLPHAGPGRVKGLPRGVKARQLDKSLELLVQVKPGTNVTVEPGFNRLNLVVNGGLDTRQRPDDGESEAPARQQQYEREPAQSYGPRLPRAPRERRTIGEDAPQQQAPAQSQSERPAAVSQAPAQASAPATSPNAPGASNDAAPNSQNNAQPSGSPQQQTEQAQGSGQQASAQQPAQQQQPQIVPTGDGIPTTPNGATAANPGDQGQTQNQATEPRKGGTFALLFSTTGVALFLALGFVALLAVRRVRAGQKEGDEVEAESAEKSEAEESAELASAEEEGEKPAEDRRQGGRRSADHVASQPAAA
ncbi:MAG TPA: hypothetical protein VF507_08810, partial [Pyrinomonadaceae bacterium]